MRGEHGHARVVEFGKRFIEPRGGGGVLRRQMLERHSRILRATRDHGAHGVQITGLGEKIHRESSPTVCRREREVHDVWPQRRCLGKRPVQIQLPAPFDRGFAPSGDVIAINQAKDAIRGQHSQRGVRARVPRAPHDAHVWHRLEFLFAHPHRRARARLHAVIELFRLTNRVAIARKPRGDASAETGDVTRRDDARSRTLVSLPARARVSPARTHAHALGVERLTVRGNVLDHARARAVVRLEIDGVAHDVATERRTNFASVI